MGKASNCSRTAGIGSRFPRRGGHQRHGSADHRSASEFGNAQRRRDGALRGDRLAVKRGTAAGTHHVTVGHRSVVRTRHAASRHRIVTARTRFAAGRHYTVAVRTRQAAVRHRGVATRTRVPPRAAVWQPGPRHRHALRRGRGIHRGGEASAAVAPAALLWRRHRRRHAGQRHGRQRGADLAVLRRVLVFGQSLQDRGLLGLLPVVDRITRPAPPVG